MKRLNELYDIDSDAEIKGIKINSKEIESGDLFVCTMGVKVDRHDYIEEAIKRGASALVVSRDNIEAPIPVIKVENTNQELPLLCRKFYDYPEEKLKMIGVTGTDGKTSTATIIQTLIGIDKCGYIGTNGRSYKDFKGDTNNTTPDVDKLEIYLDEFVQAECPYACMEASSEAFFRGRMQGLLFDVSVITNITKEHLNIHGSYENYIECKSMLFKQTKQSGVCVLNHDDAHFEEVKKACNGKVVTYGKEEGNTLQIVSYKVNPKCTYITYKYQDKLYDIKSPLLGEFNVYNLAGAILACLSLDFTWEELMKNLDQLNVDGRMELLDTDTPYYVMIDYAHTPNGITNLLNFVHTLDINRSIVVIGSAGERDYLKRPIMGQTILDNASYAIFTYEDPRSEDPHDIIEQLIKTAKNTHHNYEIEVDRRTAIRKAINMAKPKDMVLILGKGNETYQKLKDETIYFNDVEEAYKAVEIRKEIDIIKE